MQFHCNSEIVGDGVIVTPFGEVDRDTAPELRHALEKAVLGAGTGPVEVDLRHVTFMDSSGIGALLAAHRLAGTTGATLRARNPAPSVHRVLDVTNVWPLLGE
jgi:anti-anti-sigma factor